jgi:hypothetical protein
VCDANPKEAGVLRGQFRAAYEPIAARESQLRALPELVRPRIDGHGPLAGLPAPAAKALPAPGGSAGDIVRRAADAIKDPETAAPPVSDAESRRQQVRRFREREAG